MERVPPKMDPILVTGGTGTLGHEVVVQLLKNNFAVTVISTREQPALPHNVSYIRTDLANSPAIPGIANAAIIVHAASNPRDAANVDLQGTKNLLAAIDKKQLKHFIYISIAGVDVSQYPYYQTKYQVEQLIANAGIPYTILRATQFHDFVLHRMIKPFDTGQAIKIPARLKFQAVDKTEVADKVCNLVINGPQNKVITIAGPQIQAIEDMAQTYLNAFGRKEVITPAEIEGEIYDLLRSGVNICQADDLGKITWQQYIANYTTDDKP